METKEMKIYERPQMTVLKINVESQILSLSDETGGERGEIPVGGEVPGDVYVDD